MAQADGSILIDTKIDQSGIAKGIKGITTAAAAAFGTLSGYAVKAGMDFEAQMSKVEAISGATGDEIAALTEKAKQMGIETKYSATESAQALEYMAMAGWKTEDMLSGIDGVMNLAAASGEDLAMVSDIVTDSMTAFGLQAKDAAHFSDVLAMASAASNTDVAMLGESFKYVAPVAGAMKYSIEDVSLALGLMANSGIKASQAGTALRSLLSRMVKPTDEVKDAMKTLGVSLTDAKGNMKPFNEVLEELRTGFGKLSDAQKTQLAASLAGQEGMSGLLAIVNASDEDFAALADQINNADGSAQRMAETMNDNLKGQITLLGSSLEGLGLAIYDNISAMLAPFVGLDGTMEEQGKNVLLGLINGLGEEIPGLEDASNMSADEIVETLKSYFQINSPSKLMEQMGGYIVGGLRQGLEDTTEIGKASEKVGKAVAEGIKKGIQDNRESVLTVARNLANDVLNIMKNAWDIHSPSKKTELFGKYLSQGLAVGLAGETGRTMGVVDANMSRIMNRMQAAVTGEAMQFEMGVRMHGMQNVLIDSLKLRSSDSDKGLSVTQTNYFNQPIENPAEVARALERQSKKLAREIS